MQKIKSHRRLLFLLLIPPVLVICLCAAFLIPRVSKLVHSPEYHDYLWSRRITKSLSEKGYPVHEVKISDSEPPGFRVLDVQVGNLVGGKKQSNYELVKEVNSIVMKTFLNESAQPQPVSVIAITLFDYDNAIYFVFVDFEIAQKFYKGEISEEEYFARWSYSQNTPRMTPP